MLPGEATRLMVPAFPQPPRLKAQLSKPPWVSACGRLGDPGPGGACAPAEVSPAVPGPRH